MKLEPFARLGIWWLVAVIAAVGLGLMITGSVRLGGLVVASSLITAAGIRMARPRSPSGLAVRSVVIDVVILLTLAAAVATTSALVNL